VVVAVVEVPAGAVVVAAAAVAVNEMFRYRKDNMNGRGFKCGNLLKAVAALFPMVAFVTSTSAAATSDQMGKAFPTPQAAVSALAQAVNSLDVSKMREIFGPGLEALKNPDQVQATNELEAFAAGLNATNALVRQSDTSFELDVGPDAFPFPVPIVQKDGQWYFDTEAGKEELLSRRVGRNELDVLKTMRAYVDAQREYASKDRMGDQVLQYAQKIASTPGKKDGLYWPADTDAEESPLGPMVADARGEGYSVQSRGQQTTRIPFHGYYFKILTQQGKDAPGGKYNYIINGRMIAGFALIAWPADYGNTGVMTFIVNQQGRVYQRDLGPKTGQLAPAITEYNPGPGWTVSPD
jgi:hypothetical protein